ncbi:MAG TPA: UbiA family prenyltransferase [Candidatus Methanoperedens sp.]
MSWRKNTELLKLCNTPASIISPFPFLAISLFLISRKGFNLDDLPILFAGITVSLLSNFAANLWNHCNDLKEDLAAGKKTILTRDKSMLKSAHFTVISLYLCSIILVYYLSLRFERQIYIYFIIWVITTWWYSDNLILKKITGFRLKEHYIGELITYGIAWPMYILSIWLIYSDLNAIGLIISTAFFFFSISLLLLKDLKDISGDRKAGLRTFGVVFFPSLLIKYSCYLMVLYYLVILNPLAISSLGLKFLVLILPFIYFFKNTFIHMYKKNWILEIGDLKALKSVGYSVYASIIIMGLSSFL